VDGTRHKILVLLGPFGPDAAAIDSLRMHGEIVMVDDSEKASELIRQGNFYAIFSDADSFLPLERALVSQQANLILNNLGEGVCIVNGEGEVSWMNKKMAAWPPAVREKIRRSCQDSFDLFARQVSPQTPSESPAFSRSKRYALNIEEQQYLEMVASPLINPSGQVLQVVAVVWDATGTRRLQQKIDAIDNGGRELVRLEPDKLNELNVGQRLKLLEDKIIRFTRDLMHFDHFAIRLLDRKSNKLEVVISAGLPIEALSVDLFAVPEGNGISGYVAATGRSYICPDVQRDPRYIPGLDNALSSLTVPLQLNDKVVGIFNIESRQKAAFNEDDRQFAEIFGRYVAMALNVLDLLRVERVVVRHNVADDVTTEMAGPLNDILSDANSLMGDYIGHDDLRFRLQQIVDNVVTIRKGLRQVAEGNVGTVGARPVGACDDPLLRGVEILVADDTAGIREDIRDILRKFGMIVTTCANGTEAIAQVETRDFDLVLSDIRMPDKTGYDVFAAARRRNQKTPVILMTAFGYDPEHNIVRASQEGLQAVLYKPFKVEYLLSEVRKAIQSVAAK